jgi:hypothetical protein
MSHFKIGLEKNLGFGRTNEQGNKGKDKISRNKDAHGLDKK